MTLISKHKIHVMLKFPLMAGIPKVWRLMPDDPSRAGVIIKEIKCTIDVGFPGGSVVKNLLLMQEIWVGTLGQEDALEKEMATHSSILAWRIPWTEEPDGLSPGGHKQLDTTEQAHAGARNVMCLNHPETVPLPTPTPWKNCLP